MKPHRIRFAILAGSLLALCSTLSRPALAQEEPGEGEEIERLTAWPPLSREARADVDKDVARLRKARTEAMEEEAKVALRAAGAGAAPILLDALGKEKDAAARGRLEAVLNAITGAEHTRLLAACFADPAEAVRTWTMARAARFPDPGTRLLAEAAWKDVLARLEKKRKVDREEHLAAALAVTASGALDGIPHLFDRAHKVWKNAGGAIRAATEGARGKEATALLLPHLAGSRDEKIAALRLLAGCGDREDAVPAIRGFLDSEDSGLRVETINALRGIVDGAPPIENLSAFDAIERAGRWKRRL